VARVSNSLLSHTLYVGNRLLHSNLVLVMHNILAVKLLLSDIFPHRQLQVPCFGTVNLCPACTAIAFGPGLHAALSLELFVGPRVTRAVMLALQVLLCAPSATVAVKQAACTGKGMALYGRSSYVELQMCEHSLWCLLQVPARTVFVKGKNVNGHWYASCRLRRTSMMRGAMLG
jgi:hypothetical protein